MSLGLQRVGQHWRQTLCRPLDAEGDCRLKCSRYGAFGFRLKVGRILMRLCMQILVSMIAECVRAVQQLAWLSNSVGNRIIANLFFVNSRPHERSDGRRMRHDLTEVTKVCSEVARPTALRQSVPGTSRWQSQLTLPLKWQVYSNGLYHDALEFRNALLDILVMPPCV